MNCIDVIASSDFAVVADSKEKSDRFKEICGVAKVACISAVIIACVKIVGFPALFIGLPVAGMIPLIAILKD